MLIIIITLCVQLTIAAYMLVRARRLSAMDVRTIHALFTRVWDSEARLRTIDHEAHQLRRLVVVLRGYLAQDKAALRHKDQLLVNRLCLLMQLQGERDQYMHMCCNLVRTMEAQGLTMDGVLQDMEYTVCDEPDYTRYTEN